MWLLNSPGLHFWANSECNLHVPIGVKLDQSSGYIQNVLILYSLGILELYFAEHWKCAQFFAHWVHWSYMAGHIQNVLRMYPLGISGSHSGVYLKCTQHLITGHIGVKCWLWSQCVYNVLSGYLGPCPQCVMIGIIMTKAPDIFKVTVSRRVHGNYIWDHFQCRESFVKKFLREEMKWSLHRATRSGKKTPENDMQILTNC